MRINFTSRQWQASGGLKVGRGSKWMWKKASKKHFMGFKWGWRIRMKTSWRKFYEFIFSFISFIFFLLRVLGAKETEENARGTFKNPWFCLLHTKSPYQHSEWESWNCFHHADEKATEASVWASIESLLAVSLSVSLPLWISDFLILTIISRATMSLVRLKSRHDVRGRRKWQSSAKNQISSSRRHF